MSFRGRARFDYQQAQAAYFAFLPSLEPLRAEVRALAHSASESRMNLRYKELDQKVGKITYKELAVLEQAHDATFLKPLREARYRLEDLNHQVLVLKTAMQEKGQICLEVALAWRAGTYHTFVEALEERNRTQQALEAAQREFKLCQDRAQTAAHDFGALRVDLFKSAPRAASPQTSTTRDTFHHFRRQAQEKP